MRRWHLLSLLLSLLAGGFAIGQLGAQPQARGGAAAFKAAQEEARQALERSRAFEQQAAQATDEATRARAEAEALAARIQAGEAEITAAETRLAIVDAQLRAQRALLAERQGPLVRLVAALQSLARRPPALVLIQPGSLDDAVRVRAVLAATLPRINQRTASMRRELDRTRALRGQQATAREALVVSRAQLSERRHALARFEGEQRSRSEGLAALSLREADRALAFGEEARRIERLAATREFQERLAADLARLPPPPPRPGESGAPPPAGPTFLMPAEGRVLTGVGELSAAGVHSRGVALAVTGDAPVRSPADGRVVYAGPFRSYGQVLIIDHGGGWTSVITNLASIAARQGDQVARGAEIGRTGGEELRLTVELRYHGRPVPITSLLAD